MTRLGSLAVAALAPVAVLVCLWFAWTRLWMLWHVPGSFFGGDLVAYSQGAQRLAATGSPYHADLHVGPIANAIENVPIGYLYPPLVAQAFTLLSAVPLETIAGANALLQAAALAVLLPQLYRRSGGRLSAASLSTMWCAAILFFPVNMALFGGNVSGWIAIGVALSLLAPSSAGFVAVVGGLVKMTPAVLAIPVLASPGPGKKSVLALGAIFIGTSLLIAPFAWADWVAVLPNILRFPMSVSPYNLSAAAIMSSTGAPTVGIVAGYGLAAAAAAASAGLARSGRHEAAVAASVAALLFLPVTLFDHYLAPTLVVAIYAWPHAVNGVRAVLATSYAICLVLWSPALVPDLRPIIYSAIVITSVLTIAVLARPSSSRVSRQPLESAGRTSSADPAHAV